MPTKILELELTQNISSIPFDEEYEKYYVLVRAKKQIIGWLHISKDHKKSITAEEIQIEIQRQLGQRVFRQAMINTLHQNERSITSYEGISVVVCTRNRTAQLSNCLQSLMKLSYPNYEIIVVDNAPDNEATQQLVAQYPVRYIRENRPGLDWARNRGIAEAKHNIVAFTDDDAEVDDYLLNSIAKIFLNNEVMGVSGFVAPAELETKAQHIFEFGYGGMGHGFNTRFIKKERITQKQLLWASNFGIGANMAFRRSVFEQIGGFDTALDVGTPSKGGGDVELFHRLVSRGHLFIYEPSMLVWHYHRKEYSALCKQVFNNGCSFGCYLIDCFRKRTVNRITIIQFLVSEWFLKWNLRNIIKSNKVPRKLSFIELYGMLTSPFAYWKTKKWNKKIASKFS